MEGWDNYEAAPLEFFHQELFRLFHEFRKSKVGDRVDVEIDGIKFNNLIAEAKTLTYKKYERVVSSKPIEKSKL